MNAIEPGDHYVVFEYEANEPARVTCQAKHKAVTTLLARCEDDDALAAAYDKAARCPECAESRRQHHIAVNEAIRRRDRGGR